MKLSLTALKKSVTSLSVAVQEQTDNLTPTQKLLHRDGIIQRFEYTYELSWKFMRRALKEAEGESRLDVLANRYDLFRLAAQVDLISDVRIWMTYHEARNKTSHIYDEVVAQEVFFVAVQFVEDAKLLLGKLEKYAA
jgi:nucleotidyltransferase substrate binding protein (TIGR01987 family)